MKKGLPKGWKVKTINEVAIIRPKKSEVRDLNDNTSISFVPMAFLNENKIEFKHEKEKTLKEVYKGYTYFRDGDVLLAKVTPCFENGKAGIAKGLTNSIGFGSSEFHIVRPKKDILAEWIYYTFLTNKFKREGKRSFTGSSGLKRVPISFIQKYSIPLPPLLEQQRIVNKLDALFARIDEAIQLVEANLELIPSLKMALLDKAFKGQLLGEVKLGKDGLPKKWELKELNSCVNIISGYAFKSNDFTSNNQIKSIKITNVGVNEFIKTDSDLLPLSFLESHSNFIANQNDVVVSLTRSIINAGLKVSKVPSSYNKSLVNQRVALLKNNHKSNLNYVYFYLNSKEVLNYVLEFSKSLNQPNLSIKALKALKIPIPPLKEQDKIVNKLNSLFQNINQLKTENQNKLKHLQNLKKSLLEQAFQDKL